MFVESPKKLLIFWRHEHLLRALRQARLMTAVIVYWYTARTTPRQIHRAGCEGGSNSLLFSFPNSSSAAKRTNHQSFISRPQNHSSRKFQDVIRTQGEFRQSRKSYV
ncbi:hypothetical protein P692DRAFT_20594800 [Suillus brevipes Sb2]|nr:hypothetical protein P692DRAFT_20594800 [Suillus brevipes Sb2]